MLTGLLVAGVFALQIYIQIFFITLLLLIPIGCWAAYVVYRIRVFFQEFKPRIVGLLMDFIDNDVNFHFDAYEAEGFLPPEKFLASKIFTVATDYAGEDLIRGQVRETPFEVCELRVKEFSESRSRLDYVFRGVFLIADFQRWDMHGQLLVLPDAYRKYLSRSERAFHRGGGRRLRDHLLPEFETFFDTYATPDTRVKNVLTDDMQRAILEFRMRYQEFNNQKEIYFSIIGDKLYVALTQPRDLLEPSLFGSNVSFETVREFYEDLKMLLDLVLEVDVLN